MNHKDIKGIIALAITVIIAFGVIWGTKALTEEKNVNPSENEAQLTEEAISTQGYDNIQDAVKRVDQDGMTKDYVVTVVEKGYVGDIKLQVFFDDQGSKVTEVKVLEHEETEGLGAKITEDDFLRQFANVSVPVYLEGMESQTFSQPETLNDGTYESRTQEADYNGFINMMTMTVENGKITAIVWDAQDEQGNRKSVMSENGEYVMTEDGLSWKEQAEALAAAVIENQSLEFLTTDEQGKTDAVSGVSISVNDFIALAENCMRQAGGELKESATIDDTKESENLTQGTKIDAVSGATISSRAVVNGVNDAFDFLSKVK